MQIEVNHIQKSFLDEELIRDASFHLDFRDKAALVGANGAGKTTLFRIITGELPKDSGTVSFKKDSTVGYLRQISDLTSDTTVYLEAMRCKESIMRLEGEMRDLERSLSEGAVNAHELLLKHEKLLFQFEESNGYAVRSEITGILKGLGFSEDEFDLPVLKLSGGEKTRLSLAKLLVEKPSLLLLDEPTNHLDLSGIRFLETTLLTYPGTVLIISHDRYFLDRLVTKVIDLDHGVTRTYEGNYSEFAKKKKALSDALQKDYELRKKEYERQEAVIERLRSFNREKSVKRAESREKLLEKMEPLPKPVKESSPMRLALRTSVRSGNDVLTIDRLRKGFGDRTLFDGVSFSIRRGEKICLIGDNGTGKTTFFKLLTGSLSPDEGEIRLGTNVRIGYYDQEHLTLHPNKTVFDELHDDYPDMDHTAIRSHLAAFLFLGDDVYKRIGELSGGERGRVSLAKLMLQDANLLLLDEPTNHLDMPGKEILEDALLNYEGTVLAVSHDRYFINRIAGRILELYNGRILDYDGNYDYYLEKRDLIRTVHAPERKNAPSTQMTAEKAAWQNKKEQDVKRRRYEKKLAALEEKIDELTEMIRDTEKELSDPAFASDAVALNQILEKKESEEKMLAAAYHEWEAMLEQREDT